MLNKKIIITILSLVFLTSCANLVIDSKSDNATTIFTESLSKITAMTSTDDLAKDKEELNEIITKLNTVIEEKKSDAKSINTIALIKAEIDLLNSWIERIDTNNADKVKKFLDIRKDDVVRTMQDLIENENRK